MNVKEMKWREECKAVGLTWVGRAGAKYSVCSCNVCGHVDEYQQGHIRAGKVRCGGCQTTKYKSVAKDGWTFDGHYCVDRLTYVNLKHSCGDDLVKVQVGSYLKGAYDCPQCQTTKYKQAVKQGWSFIDHYCENRLTYINLKHNCSDTIVKVQLGNYLKGVYDCPHCMHTHFSDPSYFYVIQVGDIIKLGISNRPNQRYTKYGLPDDSQIIEHLRIPLENKRDALVVESYAKQLVKEFKIPTDISKQVFTKSGYNECYDIECLPMLMSI